MPRRPPLRSPHPPVPRYLVFNPSNGGTWGDRKPTYILAMRVAQALAQNPEWKDKYCVLLLCQANLPKEQFIFSLANLLFGKPLTKTDPTTVLDNLSTFGCMESRREYIRTKTVTWTAEGSCLVIMSQGYGRPDPWRDMVRNKIEGRPFFFESGRCETYTIERDMDFSFSCDYSVSYGDNGSARNLRFALSCLDGIWGNAKYAPLLLPPPLSSHDYFSAEKSYSPMLRWVNDMKSKKLKILGFMVSTLKPHHWLLIFSAFLDAISETEWAIVMLGPPINFFPDPKVKIIDLLSECSKKYVSQKKRRIYVPESYIEYEDIVPLCDYVIVGLGAGSVTVPIVYEVPFTAIHALDAGQDKWNNKEAVEGAQIGAHFHLDELVEKKKVRNILKNSINDVNIAMYKTNLTTFAQKKNGGVTKETYDEKCRESIKKFITDNIACKTCGLLNRPSPPDNKRRDPPSAQGSTFSRPRKMKK